MSKDPSKYRDPERELKRQATIKKRKGPNWIKKNAQQAAKQTPTKFTSETGSNAANVRWARYREAQRIELANAKRKEKK